MTTDVLVTKHEWRTQANVGQTMKTKAIKGKLVFLDDFIEQLKIAVCNLLSITMSHEIGERLRDLNLQFHFFSKLSLAANAMPGSVNLAAGIPSPETFPIVGASFKYVDGTELSVDQETMKSILPYQHPRGLVIFLLEQDFSLISLLDFS